MWNPGLWEGAGWLPTRRAGGVDPEGGPFGPVSCGKPVERVEQGLPLSMGFPREIQHRLQAGIRMGRWASLPFKRGQGYSETTG